MINCQRVEHREPVPATHRVALWFASSHGPRFDSTRTEYLCTEHMERVRQWAPHNVRLVRLDVEPLP